MSNNISSKITFPEELSVAAAFTGSDQLLGVTSSESVWWCVDNQSTVDVALYINGVLWKTFSAGEALVVDANTNKGNAPVLPLPANTRLSLLASAGSGSFRISLIYKG